MNPPLRSEADRRALVAALADGTIDAIATDHAPHTVDDKRVEYEQAAFGIVGLETAVGLCLDRLVGTGLLTLPRLVALLSSGPARAFGLPGGTLAPGAPGDVTVLDLGRKRKVDPTRFLSKGRNTPFGGWALTGAAVMTIVAGQVVWRGPGRFAEDAEGAYDRPGEDAEGDSGLQRPPRRGRGGGARPGGGAGRGLRQGRRHVRGAADAHVPAAALRGPAGVDPAARRRVRAARAGGAGGPPRVRRRHRPSLRLSRHAGGGGALDPPRPRPAGRRALPHRCLPGPRGPPLHRDQQRCPCRLRLRRPDGRAVRAPAGLPRLRPHPRGGVPTVDPGPRGRRARRGAPRRARPHRGHRRLGGREDARRPADPPGGLPRPRRALRPVRSAVDGAARRTAVGRPPRGGRGVPARGAVGARGARGRGARLPARVRRGRGRLRRSLRASSPRTRRSWPS